jgi:hypothetical protein
VYDEKNQAVADAVVEMYSAVTRTNKYGVFTFENVKLDGQGTYIKISKNGYFVASDYIYPIEKATSYSYTKMLTLTGAATFESGAGASVSMGSEAKVVFPPDAFSTVNGSPYNGKVQVFSAYIDPLDSDVGHSMPGGLVGLAIGGNTNVLGTLGMIGIELRDPAGNVLQIKSGKKSTIEFPARPGYSAGEIPLWAFDEKTGKWKEEGVARLSGGKYIADVSHFSFWNVDKPFHPVDVCGKLVYADGTAAANIHIKVETDGLVTYHGVTNSNGEFCGKMPKDKKLKIIAYNPTCKSNLTVIEVGPFNNKTILDNIILKNVSSFKIGGLISCSSSPVAGGIVVVEIKELTLVYKSDQNGGFNADLGPFLCGENPPISIFAFDPKTSESSPIIAVNQSNAQNIQLNVCTVNCNLQGTINYDCNKTLTAVINGGSGNYSFKWDYDSSTGKSLTWNFQDSSTVLKTYCVTVKDLTNNCEKTFCTQIAGKLKVTSDVNCDQGTITINTSGGLAPYTYLWSTGSTDRQLKPNTTGTYCVTVTDAGKCTAVVCADISSPLSLSATPLGCNKNIYSFASSPFDNGQITGAGLGNDNPLTYPISVDVFKTGFNFGFLIKNKQCNTLKQISLPQLIKGLNISVINTTCKTCSDGKINITVNASAECKACKTGAIKIFSKNDINTDLTVANGTGKLPQGDYYVVVADAVTGCYIAIEDVVIK